MRPLFALSFPLLFLAACSAAVEPAAVLPEEEEVEIPVPVASTPLAAQCLNAASFVIGAPASTGGNDAMDEALSEIGRTRASFGLTAEALAVSKLDVKDVRVFATTTAALHAPAELPTYGHGVATRLDEAVASATPVTRAILVASAMREAPATACPSAGGSLAEAITAISGDPAAVQGLPRDLQDALAPVVRALKVARDEIVVARGTSDLQPAANVPAWLLGVRRFELTETTPATFEAIDSAKITSAGAALALTVENAELARFKGRFLPSIDITTSLGRIVLRGPGADTFLSDDAPAFLFDTGGDDTYRAPVAAASLERPVSVLVDLGGDDDYGYVETADVKGTRLPSDAAGRHETGRTLSDVGRQGSGVLGVGLLFDLGASRDHYRSLVGSQGIGSHGVGVLFDDGGDDLYEAEGFSQGAAAWGVGLLLDRGGDDRYVIHNSGQGFGFTRGVGAIVDSAGDDTYRADVDGSVLYPADQLEGNANHSFAQGCGAGHRPDWPDVGFPFPGGIGILRDARGDDRYEASVFAQGTGFVQGLGALLDGAGDDTYDGLYYVQSSSAHVGAALLLDETGDDRYGQISNPIGPALGVASDLSVAVFYDAAGDDRYAASWIAFGAGLSNGAGLFVDGGGADRFVADSSATFGFARKSDASARKDLPSLGVFVKTGGTATYSVEGHSALRTGLQWLFGGSKTELGVGLDAPSKHVSF